MYKLVKKILDKSREEKVDVYVAADMVAVEVGRTEEFKKAREVVDKYYNTITKCRREDDEASIEKLCTLIEAEDKAGIEALKAEIAER